MVQNICNPIADKHYIFLQFTAWNFDQDDQTIYHDTTDTSEISTADGNISDIDNAEDNGSTSSDDHNVTESGNDDLEGIVPLLESSTIDENDVLVKSVNAALGN